MKDTKEITLEELKKMVVELQDSILNLQYIVKYHLEQHRGINDVALLEKIVNKKEK